MRAEFLRWFLLGGVLIFGCRGASDQASGKQGRELGSAIPPSAAVLVRDAGPQPTAVSIGDATLQEPSVSDASASSDPLRDASRARRVLHFGDSMVPLIANYLRPVLALGPGAYQTMTSPSATTLTWLEDARLERVLRGSDPELVLISLGSNEIFVQAELQKHLAAARGIVAKIGARPCLWIGPPAWAQGYGFVEALATAVAPCAFFHSEKLKLERQADGRHPTWAASHAWAQLVWRELGGKNEIPKQ